MTLFRRDLRRESYLAILDLQEQVKSALIARMARGRRHGPDRRSIREPLATLAHNAHHAINPAQHLIDRCRQLAAAARSIIASKDGHVFVCSRHRPPPTSRRPIRPISWVVRDQPRR
jgi:ADP-heptose:LPS heptosyltransferase